MFVLNEEDSNDVDLHSSKSGQSTLAFEDEIVSEGIRRQEKRIIDNRIVGTSLKSETEDTIQEKDIITRGENSILNNQTVGRNSTIDKDRNINTTNPTITTQMSTTTIPELKDEYKNFTIKYYCDDNVNTSQVRKAIKRIENKTCLVFEKSESPVSLKKGINFITNIECNVVTNLSTYNSDTLVNLFPCLRSSGYYEQEIAERLGAIDENSLNKRENYLKSLSKRIKTYLTKGYYEGNFSSLQNFSNILGKEYQLSFRQFKIINDFYCNKCRKRNITCLYGGYQNPKNCSTCVCPYGYTGDTCKNLDNPNKTACNGVIFTASKSEQAIATIGKKHCVYRITSKSGINVYMKTTFINSTLSPYPSIMNICPEGIGFEMKISEDKTERGVCVCGNFKSIKFTSQSSEILVIYNGLKKTNGFGLYFRETNFSLPVSTTKKNNSLKRKEEKRKTSSDTNKEKNIRI
uniref:Astacin domain-containing protein n=1 Tax=Parastrongyloides trichosuri TaxID=131310 RepID=A0A0N4Z3H0_PARTI